ncbi:MAG: hypothetical protein H6550_02215 [Chitinophagales bacterium]|nr:hypothetical protein [Chitinophagales bacterium]
MKTLCLIISLSLYSLSASAGANPVLDSLFKSSLSKDYSKESMFYFFNVIDSLSSLAEMIDNYPERFANYAKHRNRPPIKLDEVSKLEDSLSIDFETASKLIQERDTPGVIYDTTMPDEWYYLPDFKDNALYMNNIRKLLLADNIYQRAIGYKLVGALKDTSFSDMISKSLVNEKEDYAGFWNANAVAITAPLSTSVLFDFIVKYEDYGDAHMMPMYIRMDTASIIQTAYERINDTSARAKILALQTMALLDTGSRPISYIVDALSKWDDNIKGYAIVSLSMKQKKNLLPYLKPLADKPEFRDVIIQVLNESESEEDIEFAETLK